MEPSGFSVKVTKASSTVRSRQCALNVSYCQSDYQAGGLLPDGDFAIPGIGILAHIFFERQRRLRIRGAACGSLFHGFVGVLLLLVVHGFVRSGPIGARRTEIGIHDVVHHAVESGIFFGICQNHQAEIFLRHQKHA
jgi:hypothetical protein